MEILAYFIIPQFIQRLDISDLILANTNSLIPAIPVNKNFFSGLMFFKIKDHITWSLINYG